MNQCQNIFDAQKAHFATGVSRSYEWRVEQLDRMASMINENQRRLYEALAKDFKTASQEYIFETAASAGEAELQNSQLKGWMEPVAAPVPRFMAETGHKAMIHRDPYGGVGPAGMGHYYGKCGFDMLTHAKSMLISPPDAAIDHLFSPFTGEKNQALQQWFEY
jgi:acyl-CoA reductase-like NAD-dependent aldehyde dehydrogenase